MEWISEAVKTFCEKSFRLLFFTRHSLGLSPPFNPCSRQSLQAFPGFSTFLSYRRARAILTTEHAYEPKKRKIPTSPVIIGLKPPHTPSKLQNFSSRSRRANFVSFARSLGLSHAKNPTLAIPWRLRLLQSPLAPIIARPPRLFSPFISWTRPRLPCHRTRLRTKKTKKPCSPRHY